MCKREEITLVFLDSENTVNMSGMSDEYINKLYLLKEQCYDMKDKYVGLGYYDLYIRTSVDQLTELGLLELLSYKTEENIWNDTKEKKESLMK